MAPSTKSSKLSSFPPATTAQARVLVLGSMPGVASLTAQQYYAHPRNDFWPIVGRLIDAPPDYAQQAYAERLQLALASGLAIWDVLRHCERPGSLDSAIVRTSEVANDLSGFVAAHPQLRAIALNGRTAEAAFRRHASCAVAQLRPDLAVLALPSTSPAHAARTRDDKLAAWRVLRDWLAAGGRARRA